MPIYLGIDAGGSKTACAVGDERGVLAKATAGGSNPLRLSAARSRESLLAAIRAACAAAGVNATAIERTCIGIAGTNLPHVRETVLRVLRESVAGQITIVADMEIAIEAALGEAAGMIVIAGAGSIAFGRNDAGCTARAGGWGHVVSDEGSGYWIGQRAVAAILRAADEGATSLLEKSIFPQWHVLSRTELLRMASSSPPPDFAQLLPAVLEAAKAGDPWAVRVLADAGTQLASLASIVAGRLWPRERWVRVALAGGVFRHSPTVRHAFYHELRARRRNVAVSFSVTEPVIGALALARKSGSQ
ncbi:MAG: N-acetylglucosamine kinase [Terriglobales bacterium]